MRSTPHLRHAALLALCILASIFAASLGRGADAPYGHPDFVSAADRPIDFRGDGSGHFPGATPPRSVVWLK